AQIDDDVFWTGLRMACRSEHYRHARRDGWLLLSKAFSAIRRSSRHSRPPIYRSAHSNRSLRVFSRTDEHRLEFYHGAGSGLVGPRALDRRNLASASAHSAWRSLTSRTANLSRAADSGRTGLFSFRRRTFNPADCRYGDQVDG